MAYQTIEVRKLTPVIGAETYSRVFSTDNLVDTQGH